MSYLSLSLNTAASSVENPLKSSSAASLAFDVAGLKLDIAEGFSVVLDPREERVVASTRKLLSLDSTTELQVTQPYNSLSQETTWRVMWTGNGTNPNFRVRRTLTINNTTTVSVTRLNDTVTRVQFSVAIGANAKLNDILLFEKENDLGLVSPFNPVNQGVPVRIVGVGSNYLDVDDAGVLVNETSIVLGVDYLSVLKVFSSSGVQVTDVLKIDSSAFNYGNRGTYKVIFVSADYIDIEAPSLVPETVSGITDGFQVFTNSIYYFAVKAKGQLQLIVDEKVLDLSLLGDTAIFAGGVTCSEVVVRNLSDANLAVEGLWCASGLNGTAC
jgi:hypothetical protein